MSQVRDILRKKKTTRDLLVPLVDKFLLEQGNELGNIDRQGLRIANELLDMQNARQKERLVRQGFSSSTTSKCMREQILNMSSAPRAKAFDANLMAIFDDGNTRNIKWILIFYKMGILVEYEKPQHDKDRDIIITPDAIVDLSKYYKGMNRIGVEVKGMNNNEWSNFRTGRSHSKWAWSRFLQVHSYMLVSGDDMWIVWGENKNTQQRAENRVERDERVITYLKQRNDYMRRSRKMGILPHLECGLDVTSQQYKDCQQKDHCRLLFVSGEPALPKLKDQTKSNRMVRRAMLIG